MREHCLSEFDFHDPYWKQKRIENDAALQLLPGPTLFDVIARGHLFSHPI
jgi:hypothetical protein